MAGFLDEMAAASRRRVAAARAGEPLETLRARCRGLPPAAPLRRAGDFDVIAELKLRSPALGQLGSRGDDPAARVRTYAEAGAAAVSVLTEPERFDGSLEHLQLVAQALAPLGVPAMRKDFLVDPYQLYEARAAGAGGALLIVRMLSREALAEMLDCAGELGLFVLVEAFDADDVEAAVDVLGGVRPRAGPKEGTVPCGDSPRGPARGLTPLLGVNCRDLRTLEVVPGRLPELAPLLPRAYPRVAESGIGTAGEAAAAVRAGYDMALIGSALMSAAEPGALLGAMLAAGRAAAT